MKVMLVKPVGDRYSQSVGPDLGFAYLARSLKRRGHEVEILDCIIDNLTYDDFARLIRLARPDFVGFKAFTKDMRSVLKSSRMAKGIDPSIITAVGGPHPSGDPEGTLEYVDEADVAFRGEAESALPVFLENAGDAAAWADIPGLVWREDGHVRMNPTAMEEDLDAIGLPDWQAVNLEKYLAPYSIRSRGPYLPVMTGRGCPYRCSYCAAHLVSGRRVRHRSLDMVIEEIKELRKRWGLRHFSIVDDHFLSDRERVVNFCERLMSEAPFMEWECGSNGIRLDALDGELIQLLERAGLYSVALGLESGSQRSLDSVEKASRVDKNMELVRLIKGKTNIKLHGFFILGFPDDVPQDVEMTIRYARSLPLDTAQFFIYTPHPGTALWKRMKEDGRLDRAGYEDYFYDTVTFTPPRMSASYLKRAQLRAYLNFYMNPKRLWGMMDYLSSFEQVRALFNTGMLVLTGRRRNIRSKA